MAYWLQPPQFSGLSACPGFGIATVTQPGETVSATRDIERAQMLGDGGHILSAGPTVGGVGVSGAPGGDSDDTWARAGIAAVEDKLAF